MPPPDTRHAHKHVGGVCNGAHHHAPLAPHLLGAFRVALISYLLVSLLVYLFVTYWIRRTLRKVIRMKMTRIDHYSYLATYWPSLIVRLILKFKPRSFRSLTIIEEHKHNHTHQ
jgi:hypothetical protein